MNSKKTHLVKGVEEGPRGLDDILLEVPDLVEDVLGFRSDHVRGQVNLGIDLLMNWRLGFKED